MLTYSTRSAVVHGFGTTIAERASTRDLDTAKTQIFADLCPCTTHQVASTTATTP